MSLIHSDPDILGGKPCIRGRRISVAQVLEMLGAGWTFDQIVEEFDLTHEQIRAALSFAAGRLEDDEERLLAAG